MDRGSESESTLEEAVEKIRSGDRAAAADFVRKFEPLLRRRIRSRLGRATRRLFDSQEVFSTVCRRLDEFVLSGHVRAASVPEMIALIQIIAQRSVIDKARVVQRLMRVEGEDGPLAREILQRAACGRQADAHPQEVIEHWASHLENPMDRLILFHWMWGESHAATADRLGISHELIRKRWQLIRERLQRAIVAEGTA